MSCSHTSSVAPDWYISSTTGLIAIKFSADICDLLTMIPKELGDPLEINCLWSTSLEQSQYRAGISFFSGRKNKHYFILYEAKNWMNSAHCVHFQEDDCTNHLLILICYVQIPAFLTSVWSGYFEAQWLKQLCRNIWNYCTENRFGWQLCYINNFEILFYILFCRSQEGTSITSDVDDSKTPANTSWIYQWIHERTSASLAGNS